MEEMTCPQCQGTMAERTRGGVRVHQCDSCQGVFLSRASLGSLIEAENDWHSHRSADTARLPRITSDMTAPPAPAKARSYVDSLFGS
jgi:Zn-finger nucleic acid-binding protein